MLAGVRRWWWSGRRQLSAGRLQEEAGGDPQAGPGRGGEPETQGRRICLSLE